MRSGRPLPACVAILLLWTGASAAAPRQETADALRARATQLIYEHQHDQAIALLRQAVAIAPDQSATHRSLASAVWLKMLFLRGAVTVDHYLGPFNRAQVDLTKPPPELVTEFQTHISKALAIAESRVASSPKDPQALYDLGAAHGLNASYIASIEGRLLAGFRAASRAYDEHERVLQLDPSRKDAGLTVGTYRYIVSTLSAPLRLMAYVAGFGGGRERGIQMLQETAAQGRENRTDAMFALVLVYNREKRYDDALKVLQELRTMHPRNRLGTCSSPAPRRSGPDGPNRQRQCSPKVSGCWPQRPAQKFPAKKLFGATSVAPPASRLAEATPLAATSRARPRRTLRRGFAAALASSSPAWRCSAATGALRRAKPGRRSRSASRVRIPCVSTRRRSS